MALPANLVCNVPAAQSREGWVDIDSGSDAVSRTPFLPWQPMAAAGAAAQQRSRITTLQFARAFGTRCSISRVPADLAAAQGASVVRVRFNGPFWTRVLTELAASGFFVAGLFANLREMLEALTRLALQNPQQLLITAADWSLGQDFVGIQRTRSLDFSGRRAKATRRRGLRQQRGRHSRHRPLWLPGRPAGGLPRSIAISRAR